MPSPCVRRLAPAAMCGAEVMQSRPLCLIGKERRVVPLPGRGLVPWPPQPQAGQGWGRPSLGDSAGPRSWWRPPGGASPEPWRSRASGSSFCAAHFLSRSICTGGDIWGHWKVRGHVGVSPGGGCCSLSHRRHSRTSSRPSPESSVLPQGENTCPHSASSPGLGAVGPAVLGVGRGCCRRPGHGPRRPGLLGDRCRAVCCG